MKFESRGEGLPETCSDPAKLYAYLRGKWIMDFTISEWKKGKREKMDALKPNGYWRIDEVT